jgi:hypothetical protein
MRRKFWKGLQRILFTAQYNKSLRKKGKKLDLIFATIEILLKRQNEGFQKIPGVARFIV